MEIVYAELATGQGVRPREQANRSLATTCLVHEAYVKLVHQRTVQWRNGATSSGLRRRAMRGILVDHARASLAAKRGGEARHVSLVELPAKDESLTWTCSHLTGPCRGWRPANHDGAASSKCDSSPDYQSTRRRPR